MDMKFFDFEVFPNWWMCVFGDMPNDLQFDESIKDSFICIDSDMPDARNKLMEIIREDKIMCGYNVKGYDLMIANAIYQGFTPQQVKIVSDIIINPALTYSSKEHMRMSPFAKRKLSGVAYQDLMDDGEGSLKEKESILGLDIEESEVDFNKDDLTQEDKENTIYYCKHDVYSSMYFYRAIVHPYTKTKLILGKHFNIPENVCRMSTNAKLVSTVLEAKRSTFFDSERIEIDIPEKIKQYCYDNLPTQTLERLRTDDKSFSTKLFDNKVSFGNGGIHSTPGYPIYVEESDDWALVNVDAASYYPSMLIQFDCLSRAVPSNEKFIRIFNERIALKHKPNRTKEDDEGQMARKLILNTTFGASGNKWLDLYDPHQCTRTCRLGQLFLAALANKIYKKVTGARIIQTNTDGILVYFRRKDMDILKTLTDEWAKISGINMEFDFVKKIWQRDVNNYLLVDTKNKVKRKGAWLIDTYEKPGYVMIGALSGFVSAKAVTQYLLNGKDIVQSIVENNDIRDFAITCKKGPTYRGVVQRMADGTEVPLFKCNRVIASKDTSLGQIYKYKMLKDKISYAVMPNLPTHCKLINKDLDTYDFNSMKSDIDYMYYISRAADLLDIQWVRINGNNQYITDEFDYFKS